jgi:hypothetical protein
MPSSNPFDEDYDPNLAEPVAKAEPARDPLPRAPASTLSPFDEGYVAPEPEPIVPAGPLITEPGAYPDIDASDYHRNPNLLPGPSLSSSGAKTLLNKSPFHFWFDSPLNPNRPPESDKPHFAVGRAAHDIILLPDRWEDEYFVTCEGFSRTKSKQMAYEIAEADEALKAGKTILSFEQAATVRAVAEAIQRSPLAVACLTNGVTEETLVWKDKETGVWLRARPDFRPHSIVEKRDVRVVADLKFVAETHLSPTGFSKAIANFGYHMSAAFYWEGIKEVFGIDPTHWVHVAIEKNLPHCVALYELPLEDIDRGHALNRRAIRKFADCLSADCWPGYADDPAPVGLPIWARMNIDNTDPDEAAFAAAA